MLNCPVRLGRSLTVRSACCSGEAASSTEQQSSPAQISSSTASNLAEAYQQAEASAVPVAGPSVQALQQAAEPAQAPARSYTPFFATSTAGPTAQEPAGVTTAEPVTAAAQAAEALQSSPRAAALEELGTGSSQPRAALELSSSHAAPATEQPATNGAGLRASTAESLPYVPLAVLQAAHTHEPSNCALCREVYDAAEESSPGSASQMDTGAVGVLSAVSPAQTMVSSRATVHLSGGVCSWLQLESAQCLQHSSSSAGSC